jgi:hypothetical protein
MRRSLLFVSLLICGVATFEVSAQPIGWGSCTREQFETYFVTHSDEGKRPVLEFFDAARKVADDSVMLFIAGQFDDLYSGMTPRASTKDKFQERLENLMQSEGKVLGYNFLDQVLLFSGPSELDLRNGGLLITDYSVRTTKWEDHTYLRMWTRSVNSVPMLQEIELEHYGPGLPDPVQNVFARDTTKRGCLSISGQLKTKL